jgi:TPR repeat protein
VAWLERSAQSGNTYGAYLAGKILLTDESVKDPARAVRNFELAAQYGNDYAEYQLGKLYLSGKSGTSSAAQT